LERGDYLSELALGGRAAVVTGGVRGLGLEMAHEGADAAVVDLLGDQAQESAQHISQETGRQVHGLVGGGAAW